MATAKTLNTTTTRPRISPREKALQRIARDLETAQDALASASHHLAYLVEEMEEEPTTKAGVRWALSMRDCTVQVLDMHRTIAFYWWLERAQRERQELLRATIRAGVESAAAA